MKHPHTSFFPALTSTSHSVRTWSDNKTKQMFFMLFNWQASHRFILISILLNLVPSAPPQIVRAMNKTSTSILIMWYEVPFGQKNGYILSYNVTYTMMNQNVTTTKQIEPPTLQVNLTELRANTNYSITVMASTIKGHGPASPAIYVSTQKEGD